MAGPFYFAWVDASETTFDPSVHNREDENVFGFSVEHSEGDFAGLEIEIRNPRIGLLAPARKVHCWLSYAAAGASPPEIKPLFHGRLVGIPNNINAEVVTLVFTARPIDFVAQRAVLAGSLRVLPHYDPIWIDINRQADPDAVLEAYSALWHIDRVTNVLTTSDILVGEDGVAEFLESDVPYDSVSINIGTPPLRSVSVQGTVNWTQSASGTIDIGDNNFTTYTGGSLMSGWPKPGASLGGGWTVLSSSAVDLYDVANVITTSFSSSYQNEAKTHENGDTMSISMSSSEPKFNGPALSCLISGKFQAGFLDPGDNLSVVFGDSEPINIGASTQTSTLFVPLWQVNTTLVLSYEAARQRSEVVTFTLGTNVQALVTLPGEDDTSLLTLSSLDVSVPIPGHGTPVGSLASRAYFPRDRGRQSLEYLILLARATLLLRARAVEVEFGCRFERAIALSCRMNAVLHDDRLPGHQALGKIVKYSFSANGDTGELIGSLTMGCAIGYGGAVDTVAGTPDYVADGYVAADYQVCLGQIVVLPGGDVGYGPPIDVATDDNLVFPLTNSQVVVTSEMHGDLAAQRAAIEASFQADISIAQLAESPSQSIEAQKAAQALQAKSTDAILKANSIWYELVLKPVTGGPFVAEYAVALTDLEAPKMIDLEAAS
jgi:hypothetical protein